MTELTELLSKYRIDDAAFKATGLKWPELQKIAADHQQRMPRLLPIANYFRDELQQLAAVHSLKARIKDPEHLIAKIIRKRIAQPQRAITLSNYRQEVTDLIGVRALHLVKEDWLPIHESITNSWRRKEKPVANIRKGDPDKTFIEAGLKVREHAAGYRSIHYVVKHRRARDVEYVEIQVRTIFEEGWSEIDHRLRYSHTTAHPLLSDFLTLFNGLAGSADHMGSYIQRLADEIGAVQRAAEEREAEQAKLRAQFETLKQTVANVKMAAPAKREIQDGLEVVETAVSSHVPAARETALARAMEHVHLEPDGGMLGRAAVEQALARFAPSDLMKKAMADAIASATSYTTSTITTKALEAAVASSFPKSDAMKKAMEDVMGRASIRLPSRPKTKKE